MIEDKKLIWFDINLYVVFPDDTTESLTYGSYSIEESLLSEISQQAIIDHIYNNLSSYIDTNSAVSNRTYTTIFKLKAPCIEYEFYRDADKTDKRVVALSVSNIHRL